ncbi:MAG: sensor histidine kinase [Peptoniphilus sp.]|nr:sensor histidine kinase [Peptoniphilus sp.]MDY6045121.1 sensor histidine kinase [Peptoniphilus sp.]
MFRNFLKERQREIAILFATAVLLSAETLLFGEETKMYGILLVASTSLLSFVAMYFSYKREREAWADLLSMPPRETAKDDALAVLRALEEALKKERHEAEEKTKRIEEYMTVWTHQLKSPLFALSLLIEDEDAEREEMEEELFTMNRYVDNLLNFYRLESTETDYLFKRTSLAPLVESCAEKYARSARLSGDTISVEVGEGEITTDEKWFRFLLEQILSNSVKYTTNGEIVLREEGGILTVEDTGIGIPKDDVPRIFERAYTGYNGRVRSKSTGLGLYLSKRVAEAINIGLSLSSEKGMGTTVSLDLRRAMEDRR